MKMIAFFIILMSISQASMSVKVSTMLKEISQEFHMPSPLNVFVDLPTFNKMKITRELAKSDISLEFINIAEEFDRKFAIVFVENMEDINQWNVKVDQQVFFVTSKYQVWEMYQIDGKVFLKVLGMMHNNGTLILEEEIEKNFLKRRSNFHGGEIIAMREELGSFVYMKENFESQVPYHKENDTFEVSEVISGVSVDFLAILEEEFNFTTKSFTRKDRKWGTPIISPNGSMIIPDGMIQNLMGNGKADMIATGYSYFYPRNLVVDFLQPQTDCDVGIFIKKGNLKEDYDFEIFFRPLNVYTWITMVFTALVFALVTFKPKMLKEPLQIFAQVWIYFKTFFGSSLDQPLEKKMSYKIVMLTSLSTGFIIWTSYTAFLMAELAIPIELLPFHDLESLSKTNYKLLTDLPGTGLAKYFTKAEKGSVKEEVYKVNMDETSFNQYIESVEKVIQGSKMAFFGELYMILYDPRFRNELDLVWTLKPKLYGCSFAMRKGSPYKEFFDWKLDQIRESGLTQIIEKKHEPKLKTKEDMHQPITWKKLAFLWIVIILGFLLSLICFMFEILIKRIYQEN